MFDRRRFCILEEAGVAALVFLDDDGGARLGKGKGEGDGDDNDDDDDGE